MSDAVVTDDLQGKARDLSTKGIIARGIVLAVILGFIVIYPGATSTIGADRFTLAVIFAIVGLSVNILMGYAGQISLGHQAFVGLGAFAAAYLTSQAGVPFFLSIPLAGLIGGVIAIFLGVVALRIQGLYLALITLAYGSLAERSIFGIPALTGGGGGTPAPRPAGFTGDSAYAYLCLGVLAFLLFIDWRMLKSKFGRALQAINSNELVAESFGMNLVFYKVGAFVMAGIFAGIGGGLLGFREQHVVSADYTFALALTFVIMTVIGGLGNRIGVVLGSAFTAYLPFILNWAADLFDFPKLVVARIAITAVLLLLTITKFPGGIGQQVQPLVTWLSGKPFPRHHKVEKPHQSIRERLGLGKKTEGMEP